MRRKPIEECPIKPIQYFWYPYVPFGMTSCFQGDAGLGKTTVWSKILAEASHGIYPPRLHNGTIKGRAIFTDWQSDAIEYMKAIPDDEDFDPAEIEVKLVNGIEIDGEDADDYEIEYETTVPMDRPFMRYVGEPIKMVYISRENDYGNIIRKKYEEYGGLPGYLTVIDESDRDRFITTEKKIREITGDAKLVIIDPIFSFVEGRLSDNVDVAEAVFNFDLVAKETGAAFVLINNLTKYGTSDLNRGLGASNLKNIVRSLFKIDRAGNKVYIEGLKNNNAPYHGKIGILFDRLGRPDFIKYSQLEKALSGGQSSEEGQTSDQGTRAKEAKELYRAMSLFQLYLGDGQRIEHQKIKAMMKAENVSTSTMNRAKHLAGVKSDTKGGGSVWYMDR